MSRRMIALLMLLIVIVMSAVIQPDAPALAAIGEITSLVTGESPKTAEAQFANGGWAITHQGERIGLLSSYPSSLAQLALLLPECSAAKDGSALATYALGVRAEHDRDTAAPCACSSSE